MTLSGCFMTKCVFWPALLESERLNVRNSTTSAILRLRCSQFCAFRSRSTYTYTVSAVAELLVFFVLLLLFQQFVLECKTEKLCQNNFAKIIQKDCVTVWVFFMSQTSVLMMEFVFCAVVQNVQRHRSLRTSRRTGLYVGASGAN